MKRHFFFKIAMIFCLCLLAGCGAPAEKAPEPETAPQAEPEETPEVQELTAIELQGFFEKAYEAKGNCLESPEQLALEVAELETLTADTALPEDYEAQYKDWRAEKVNSILEPIQAKYDAFIAELPQSSGPIPGACYADYVDFEGDGCPELLVIFQGDDPDYGGSLADVVRVYASGEKGVEKIGETLIDYRISVELCMAGKRTFMHTLSEHGGGAVDNYYGIKDDAFSLLDRVSRYDPLGDGEYTSFDKPISKEEYESIQSKYSEAAPLSLLYYSDPTTDSRGILPEPSPDVLHRAALIKALDSSNAQYARLADMDGDGTEDLLVVVEGKFDSIFRAYTWTGSEVQAVDIAQGESIGSVSGIYREKSTGKIYAGYSGGAGPYSWNHFERVSEIIRISDENLGYAEEDIYSEDIYEEDSYWEDDYEEDSYWEGAYDEAAYEEYLAKLNQFELIEDLMWQLPKYETVEAVRQQLIAG